MFHDTHASRFTFHVSRNHVSGYVNMSFYQNHIKYIPPIFLFIIISCYGVCRGAVPDYDPAQPGPDILLNPLTVNPEPNPGYKNYISKKDIRTLLDSRFFVNIRDKSFEVASRGRHFRVDTSIDVPLQNFIIEKIARSSARYIGIVVMEPGTGRVLSMVGFDERDPYNNPCTASRFPAASIFKIVTAAAAIEKCGFNSDSQIAYSGRKHTLYKGQLKKKPKRRTRKITLRDSFAESVNPVFGKLGAHYLGKNLLEKYADAFGFNRRIGFEIPVVPSILSVSEDPYHCAEIASGFNRETLISPLHGAMIASAIMNQGRLTEPVIVDQIVNKKNRVIYKSRRTPMNHAISPHASEILKHLMQATIEKGTCRKAFRGYQKDPVLSELNIGGKTGTISSENRDARYDWFVGFAEEKEGKEKLVISAVVAHGKRMGIKAKKYARMIIREYFSRNSQPSVGSLQSAAFSGQPSVGSLQWAVFSRQPSAGSLQSPTICGLPTADCRLPTVDCRLPTVDCGLPTEDCRLKAAHWQLPTAH
ncbi:penicillin-binding transpeptidase domain-containing protein [Desulfococcaceae bacterium HSG8]|nr:penicillin-binding transpeptidase domain-containing protein [Desulfococcaceae bacterium HSG8]